MTTLGRQSVRASIDLVNFYREFFSKKAASKWPDNNRLTTSNKDVIDKNPLVLFTSDLFASKTKFTEPFDAIKGN